MVLYVGHAVFKRTAETFGMPNPVIHVMAWKADPFPIVSLFLSETRDYTDGVVHACMIDTEERKLPLDEGIRVFAFVCWIVQLVCMLIHTTRNRNLNDRNSSNVCRNLPLVRGFHGSTPASLHSPCAPPYTPKVNTIYIQTHLLEVFHDFREEMLWKGTFLKGELGPREEK